MKTRIQINEYSLWTRKKYDYDWYEWCVFIDESKETISTVERVQYSLHPSFPDPVRTISDSSSCFGLFSAGWGGFTIGITVTFVDGSTIDTSYFLKLLNNWPKEPVPNNFTDDDMARVYKALIHEKYRWRKVDTVLRETDLIRDRVSTALSRLENDGLARKAYFQSVDNKDLWGATSVVGRSPRPS